MQLKVKNAVQTHLKNEKSHIRAVSVKHRQKPCDRDVTDNNLQALTSAQQSQGLLLSKRFSSLLKLISIF